MEEREDYYIFNNKYNFYYSLIIHLIIDLLDVIYI
jgi:hypothetical protein